METLSVIFNEIFAVALFRPFARGGCCVQGGVGSVRYVAAAGIAEPGSVQQRLIRPG